QRLVFQGKFQQLMTVWLVVSILVLITRHELSVGPFVVILPPLPYFCAFLFTSRIRKWLVNLMLFILLGGALLIRYWQLLGIASFVKIDDSQLLLPAGGASGNVKGSSVLVLGDDMSYYEHNKLATPYLNWQLSQRYFSRLDEYQSVYDLYQNFRLETP